MASPCVAWHHPAWHDMASPCVTWHGMAWHSMAWHHPMPSPHTPLLGDQAISEFGLASEDEWQVKTCPYDRPPLVSSSHPFVHCIPSFIAFPHSLHHLATTACPNIVQPRRCGKRLPDVLLRVHMKECQWGVVPCSHEGCSSQLQRKHLAEHLEASPCCACGWCYSGIMAIPW